MTADTSASAWGYLDDGTAPAERTIEEAEATIQRLIAQADGAAKRIAELERENERLRSRHGEES